MKYSIYLYRRVFVMGLGSFIISTMFCFTFCKLKHVKTNCTNHKLFGNSNTCNLLLCLFQGPFKLLPYLKSPCWFNTQQELRCLPFFFLIGAPKSGTTDVYYLLKRHPAFNAPSKELHWFTRIRFKNATNGFDYYTKLMAEALKGKRNTGPSNGLVETVFNNSNLDITLAHNIILGKCD